MHYPEMRIGIDLGGTKIEIKVKGEKEPITLTVGAADGDKGYFAMSSRMPGDVFLLAKSLFDDLKKGPGYFGQ